MAGQRVASLEIELAMATGGAVSDLNRFGGVVDKVSAQAIRDLDHIDAAMKGVGGMSGPTAQMVKFAEETAKSAVSAARELNRIEKAGESLSAQMTRQIGVFGKTTSEIRSMKVEAAAAAAEQAQQFDLAARLRAQEAALYDLEFAAARRAAQATEALAQERSAAAAQAEQAAEREATALRQAAAAHAMFEAAARRGMTALREQEAAQAAAAREAGQLRAALDPMFAAQQRFDNELERAERLLAAGAISEREYAQAIQLSRDTLRDHAQAVAGAGAANDHLTEQQRKVTAGAGANRAAMAGLSYQLQDTFTQLSMGANAFQVVAIQGGQVAGQFSNIEGKAGNLARFMLGPWGLAFTAAALVLGPLVGKLLNMNSAVDDAVDKLKKDAQATEDNRIAKDRFARSADGVAAAIRAGTEATRLSIEGLRSSAENDNIAAKREVLREIAIRKVTLALIEQAKAQADAANGTSFGAAGGAGAAAAQVIYSTRLGELQKAATEQQKLIAQAEARVGVTRIDLAVEAAARAIDPLARIKKLYDDQAAAAKRAAAAQAAAGHEVGSMLTRELADIERNRNAAVKAEQDKQSAAQQTANQIGRNISLSEARGIAQSVGGTVTSDHRTRAEQEALYAKYVAYKDGSGPWAALAAKPGTSNHELDRALDVAKSGGVTLKKLVDAYRAAGVHLVEALDEGSHYHVAWKPVGEAARMAAGERTDATKAARDLAEAQKQLGADLADVVQKFDPARAAAEEYAKTLATIDALVSGGKLTIDQAGAYRMAAANQEQARQAEDQRKQFERLFGAGDPLADGIDAGVRGSAQRNEDRDAEKAEQQAAYNEALRITLDTFDAIDQSAQRAAQGMSNAFGNVGASIGDALTIMTGFYSNQARMQADHDSAIAKAGTNQQQIARENQLFAVRSSAAQVQAYGDMASAAKGFFKEGSSGYHALAAAEKIYRVAQFAMSLSAMVQNAAETLGFVTNAAARATADGAAGIAAQSKLPFPANLIAMAATAAALVAAGIAIIGGAGGGGHATAPTTNTGTGTVLGDPSAKSDSIKRAIDELGQIDTLTNVFAREMAASLKSIDSQIGNVASLVVRAGNVDASGDVTEGFKTNAIGSVLSKIPLIGGFLGSLFGSKTTVVGNGLYGGAQTVGNIVNSGFDAQYYSDIEKKKKFFGITTSTKTSTQYTAADPGLENQFTLILKSFNTAIAAAAVPLGVATDEVQARLNSFVVNIGKIDLKGLTGEQIEEKLDAIFGAAADGMAEAAFPGLQQFQKVGEGTFETLVRVASTVEAVGTSLDLLSQSAVGMSVAAKLGLADQFDSISALTSAADAYFQGFYTKEEQAAAKTAQLSKVFGSLNLAMPTTIANYRHLVEAQDLTTAAGQSTYATLLKLAPAFADLQSSMEGARSAADVAAERQDLERKMLELRGDTAAIRALDLAKLDASNRGLQEQIWAVQDAQDAAKAAEQLRDAWKSVGDTIMAEVRRIRGLTDASGGGTFASLMGQFNAATSSARAGDQDAAKNLPQLSKALLDAAALQATSRQELDRVQAQTAASLEATYGVVSALSEMAAAPTPTDAMLAAVASSQAAAAPTSTTASMADELRALREEVAAMRKDNNDGNAAIAKEAKRTSDVLNDVSGAGGGTAFATIAA